MEKIKAAIVGLGRIASLLEEDARREKPCTHAGAIAANPDCVLVGGCDTDEERRGLFAERWGVPVYADAGEMVRAQSPQILVIATHPDSHYHYCRLAAASGVAVVICEKPLADSLSAARKIAGLAKQGRLAKHAGLASQGEPLGGFAIIINHERRYSADYVKAKEILASEKLGSLLSVRAVLYMTSTAVGVSRGGLRSFLSASGPKGRMGKNKRLLDVFWHDGTHLADGIMFLTGLGLKHRKRWGAKLTSSGGTTWLEGELVQTFGLQKDKFASIPVVTEVGAGRDHLVFEMEFSCAKGRLRIGNGVFEVWESDESPYAEKFRSLKRTVEAFEGPTGYFANMIADAVSCVRQPDRQPVSSAADGLRVIEYLHSIEPW